jgi:hypothetical protein
VMEAGPAQLRTRRKTHVIVNPTIKSAPRHPDLQFIPRTILRWIDVDDELWVQDAEDADPASRPRPTSAPR